MRFGGSSPARRPQSCAVIIANPGEEMATATRRPRLFFALWPDPATRAALARLQTGLAGRPLAAHKLHLTMAFLGQRGAADLAPLGAILARVEAAAATLEFDRLDYFSGQRIAWAGMGTAPPALAELRAALMRELAAEGYAPAFERDRFRPHVTLARQAPPLAPAAIAPLRWRADALVLAASEGNEAPYRILAARKLA